MLVWKSSIDCENRCSLLNVVLLAADWACEDDGNQSDKSETSVFDQKRNLWVQISTTPKKRLTSPIRSDFKPTRFSCYSF